MTTRNLTSTRRCRTGQRNTQFTDSKSDKMSKMLASYAVILDPGLARKEVLLRAELIEGFELFKESRIELGRRLYNYRTVYKPQRLWTRLAEKLGSEIRRTSRTIFRLVEEYEESVNLREPRSFPTLEADPDGAEPGDPDQLSTEEVDFLEARRLLREAVAKWDGYRRIAVLKQAIQEECRASWEIDEPFTLQIKPCLPLIMVTDEGLFETERAAA
jgi:hypothetical protein